ncbi:MAG: CHASE3 domain-containing protein [Verrucomicrobiae bacterium]|nr:CHASE3 domain-containing protein [Verrucomicrobiae bacterium]
MVRTVERKLKSLPKVLNTGVTRFQPRLHTPLVVLWLTLSIAGVAITWLTWKELSDHVDRGVQVTAFNESLERVFSTLQDAETAVRGFALTGAEIFLEPQVAAERDFPEQFAKLAEMAWADRDLRQPVLQLQALAVEEMAMVRQTIEERRRGGLAAAAASVETQMERHPMDRIRGLVIHMRSAHQNPLTTAGDTTRMRLRRANLTSLAAGVLGVGLGFFAFYLTRLGLQHERRERALAEAKLHAEQSSDQKSTFLAHMSHEIRTPMNAIIGFAELLGRELKEPRQQHYLHSIRTASDSLLQLINDVLDLSKIESGMLELRPEPTDPRDLCTFIHTLFDEQAARRGLQFTCDTDDRLPRALLLDQTRLRQVLVNLVGNAVKFTETGFIRMRMKGETDTGGRILLNVEIEDSGIGIPPDRLNAIFEPFTQADGRRPQEQDGAGLGLAIVRRLVEIMGGTIVVSSIVGRGTTFHLRIPGLEVANPASTAASAISDTDPQVSFNALRAATLLVVDDHPLNRDFIAGLFADSHHRLHFGTDGTEAVTLARSLRPDAVLLDVRMPGLDGREALAQIRAIPGLESVPVIAVTASSLIEDELDLRQQFTAYVRKPFTARELFDALAKFLPHQASVGFAAPAAAADIPSASPAGSLVPPCAAPPGLMTALRNLETGAWPTVRDGMGMAEVRDFAARLNSLGQSAGCTPLVDYANRLQHHADAYDAAALDSELTRFPQVIRQIEAALTDPQ